MRKTKKLLCLLLVALFSLFIISCGKNTQTSRTNNAPVAEERHQ